MSEQQAIQDVLAGKTNSFVTIVDLYKDMVYSISFQVLGNEQDAEECAQDSFLKAFNKLNSFKNESKFSTWLYKIAYYSALNLKKSRKNNTVELNNNYQPIQEEGDKAEKELVVNNALKELSEEDRIIVSLYYLDEKSVKEVAEITDLTESNVKVKLMRSREKLKEVFLTMQINS